MGHIISKRTFSFEADAAAMFGLSEAVFTAYLMEKIETAVQARASGAAAELLVKDGSAWMPWTLDQLSEELPFWTQKQIRRIKDSCIKQNLIRTECLNQDPRDRRLWYSVVGQGG